MDEKDVAPSPEWGPTRSVASVRGLRSPGTSRFVQSSQQRPRDNDRLTRLNSSNLSGLRTVADSLKTGWYSNDKPESTTDIYPYETTKSYDLIALIQKSERTQTAIQATIDVLQRHAKWFTQAALVALLQHALSKASESTSTADLEVTLELISSVITFSVLPSDCLQPVVKFIAFSYHNGTRMHKHRSLATKAWNLYRHILSSHLGPLSVDVLLELVEREETQWSRSSFAAVSGALQLLQDKFDFGGLANTEHSVAIGELLTSLANVVKDGDENLKELLIALLYKSITTESTVVQIDSLAYWPTLLELVDGCALTAEDAASHDFLDSLAKVAPRLEPTQLDTLSVILLRASRDLPTEVSAHLLIPSKLVHRLYIDSDKAMHDKLLRQFSMNSHYDKELQIVADNDLEYLVLREDRKEWSYLSKQYLKIASSEGVSREIAICCANFLCALFHSAFKTSYDQSRLWKVSSAWDTVTKLAVSAPRPEARLCALRYLSRMRVTINGYVYIEECEDTSGVIPEGTLPGLVLLSDLPRALWLDEVLMLIQGSELEQNEITSSYVLATLPAQLGNLLFFVDQKDHVKAIYHAAIRKLGGTISSKSNLFVRILTALVNYRGLFSLAEERQMVDLFIQKAGSSEIVSKDCIHALTLCCHEIPETVARELDHVIQKMAQMITQKHLAIHVLEFLTGLSRLPNLFRNFRTDDFRKIFGVCVSYLLSLRDGQLSRQSTNPGSDTASGSQQATHEIVPQYVYALAHHVMIFWYLVLRPDDRQMIKTYVTSSLCYVRDGDKEIPDDQGLVVIDFMERTDSETTAQTGLQTMTDGDLDEVFDDVDGKILTQHRMCGLVLISTHTSLRTAKTLVTTRRPSGTAKYIIYGRNPVAQESWTSSSVYIPAAPASLWSGSADGDETMTIYSDDTDGLAYGSIPVPHSASLLGAAEIITLPEQPALDRAIQSFDRIPGLDSHKAGVIYIGENQRDEDDILANSSGSPDYRDIVENLGNLQELKGATFNTQGLNTRDDSDGAHVIVWNNEITELVFHVTTMMPTDIEEKHISAVSKKAHIGNDHVNIVFNNSGRPFHFDTFPSQFNYVYIVITPSVRTTFLQTRTHTVNVGDKNRFYKVEVVTKAEFPALSSAAEAKMISGASLPGYVRNLALNACVFSEVWINRNNEEYRSSWRMRLTQLRRLRERHAPGASVTRHPSVIKKGKGKATFWK